MWHVSLFPTSMYGISGPTYSPFLPRLHPSFRLASPHAQGTKNIVQYVIIIVSIFRIRRECDVCRAHIPLILFFGACTALPCQICEHTFGMPPHIPKLLHSTLLQLICVERCNRVFYQLSLSFDHSTFPITIMNCINVSNPN